MESIDDWLSRIYPEASRIPVRCLSSHSRKTICDILDVESHIGGADYRTFGGELGLTPLQVQARRANNNGRSVTEAILTEHQNTLTIWRLIQILRSMGVLGVQEILNTWQETQRNYYQEISMVGYRSGTQNTERECVCVTCRPDLYPHSLTPHPCQHPACTECQPPIHTREPGSELLAAAAPQRTALKQQNYEDVCCGTDPVQTGSHTTRRDPQPGRRERLVSNEDNTTYGQDTQTDSGLSVFPVGFEQVSRAETHNKGLVVEDGMEPTLNIGTSEDLQLRDGDDFIPPEDFNLLDGESNQGEYELSQDIALQNLSIIPNSESMAQHSSTSPNNTQMADPEGSSTTRPVPTYPNGNGQVIIDRFQTQGFRPNITDQTVRKISFTTSEPHHHNQHPDYNHYPIPPPLTGCHAERLAHCNYTLGHVSVGHLPYVDPQHQARGNIGSIMMRHPQQTKGLGDLPHSASYHGYNTYCRDASRQPQGFCLPPEASQDRGRGMGDMGLGPGSISDGGQRMQERDCNQPTLTVRMPGQDKPTGSVRMRGQNMEGANENAQPSRLRDLDRQKGSVAGVQGMRGPWPKRGHAQAQNGMTLDQDQTNIEKRHSDPTPSVSSGSLGELQRPMSEEIVYARAAGGQGVTTPKFVFMTGGEAKHCDKVETEMWQMCKDLMAEGFHVVANLPRGIVGLPADPLEIRHRLRSSYNEAIEDYFQQATCVLVAVSPGYCKYVNKDNVPTPSGHQTSTRFIYTQMLTEYLTKNFSKNKRFYPVRLTKVKTESEHIPDWLTSTLTYTFPANQAELFKHLKDHLKQA